MKAPFRLEHLLKELDRVPRSEDRGAPESRRDEALARLKRLQRHGLRERGAAQKARTLWALAAVALTLVAAIAIVGFRSRGPLPDVALSQVRLRAVAGLVEVSRHGSREIVGADARLLSPDDTVETRAGAVASLFLPSGATFSVGERAALQVDRRAPAHEEVRLTLGRIDVHVPKLQGGGSFVVRSEDATVSVRGTRFAVVVESAPGTRLVTRVEVSEGIVAVANGGKTVELRSGDRWSSAAPEPHAEADVGPDARGVGGPPLAEAPSTAATRPSGKGAPPSTLGTENELLSQAMTAAAAGDDANALVLLGAFLSKHPGSPLAENASVERLRLLSRTGNRAAAARAARAYLARYPEGLGRDLARRLATDPTGAPGTPKPR